MRNEYQTPLDGHPLAAFAAVIELGSFDAAAERLHVTPSAVSQRIKALEQRVGQVLVVREKPCTATQAGWASSAAIAELFGVPAGLLNDDRLGRALEALAPVAERVRGAAASRRGVDLSRLHLDMTRSGSPAGVTARHGKEMGRRPDHRPAGQDHPGGHPGPGRGLLRGHPGGANEAPCIAAALDRIRELAPPGVVCVADAGLGYLARLCAADAAGLRFVLPLRAETGWANVNVGSRVNGAGFTDTRGVSVSAVRYRSVGFEILCFRVRSWVGWRWQRERGTRAGCPSVV